MSKISAAILKDAVFTGGDTPKLRQIQLFTLPNVKSVLDYMGWKVRFDMMHYRPVIVGPQVEYTNESQSLAVQAIEDNLRRCGINPGEKTSKVLAIIGMADKFHPMEDWMLEAEWDGEDRVSDLVATVPADGDMWPIYLRRWLVQVVEAAVGWRDTDERALAFCLVFSGAQGIGKTQWFRRLAPGFVRTEAELHLSKSDSKDHKLDVLRFPIVELSEIDATFGASNISTLKTFLSAGRDVIRAPFQATPIERVRSSVFGGTVNDARFLTDPTGTRRFWPVNVSGPIDWNHTIEPQQLWAQAYHMWAEGEPMVLSSEEDALRMQSAGSFQSVSPAVEAVAGWWADYRESWETYAALNISQICRLTGASSHPGAANAVRAWLQENVGPDKKIGIKQRSWAFPLGAINQHNLGNVPMMDASEAKRRVNWRD